MDTGLNLKFKIKQDIAYLLVNRLENKSIDPIRAADIADFVISAIPSNITNEQMISIIPKLDDQFFELTTIVNKYMMLNDKEITNKNLSNLRISLSKYLQNKNV